MIGLKEDIVNFFKRQSYTIVSTIDIKGNIHNSCKGIVQIDKNGEVYLFDLYKRKTFLNLKNNPTISITAVDEYKFEGYCLKGRASIVKKENFTSELLKSWDKKINSRASKRLVKNIREKKPQSKHPEISLPKPEYMIMVKIQEVICLTPQIKKE